MFCRRKFEGEHAMAVMSDRPYAGQNFLVDLGDGNTEGAGAGFMEVSGIALTLDISDHRSGNSRGNSPSLHSGLARYPLVTLRRGVIGSLNLYAWINEVRNGGENARRTVTISLQTEDQSAVVMTWKLMGAWPVQLNYTGLDANGTDVAMEELVLAYERLEME
jgi:phage tail-like protein